MRKSKMDLIFPRNWSWNYVEITDQSEYFEPLSKLIHIHLFCYPLDDHPSYVRPFQNSLLILTHLKKKRKDRCLNHPLEIISLLHSAHPPPHPLVISDWDRILDEEEKLSRIRFLDGHQGTLFPFLFYSLSPQQRCPFPRTTHSFSSSSRLTESPAEPSFWGRRIRIFPPSLFPVTPTNHL